MQFHEIINAKYTNDSTRPMMQKDAFPVNDSFQAYLQHHGRDIEIPVRYTDLANYSYADSLKDKKGKWTHWENAVYESGQKETLKKALIETYIMLKNRTNWTRWKSFDIERIDFCEYGNSIPFRIKIIDRDKKQHDFFYIKQADASRIYGLELEHLLTHNPINFISHQNTLVEEHIDGIPGDLFLQQEMQFSSKDKIAIAKAFVQFNESCFARLLGDMRSYNFVVNPIAINGNIEYRLRAIDFDQQCYEGRKNYYLPQFYIENIDFVELVLQNLTATEIEATQQIEFNAMAARIIMYRQQLMQLVNTIIKDDISENYKINTLRTELNEHFNTTRFSKCKTMGAIVKQQLKQVLQKYLLVAGRNFG